jgi:hypothetical protein
MTSSYWRSRGNAVQVTRLLSLVAWPLLMIQLQTFSRMFMEFRTAPLALIGVTPWKAIVDTSVRCSHPVVLAAAAAALAMIPTPHSVFWGSMSIAIMGCLEDGPALCAAWSRIRRDSSAQPPAETTPALSARLANEGPRA